MSLVTGVGWYKKNVQIRNQRQKKFHHPPPKKLNFRYKLSSTIHAISKYNTEVFNNHHKLLTILSAFKHDYVEERRKKNYKYSFQSNYSQEETSLLPFIDSNHSKNNFHKMTNRKDLQLFFGTLKSHTFRQNMLVIYNINIFL